MVVRMRVRLLHRSTLLLIAAVSGLFSSLAGSVSAEPLLRWKLSSGESLAYQFKQSTQTETAGTGKAMRMTLETAMTITWKVDSVDAQQVATITQTIDAFSVTMTTDKLDPIVYDSASKTPPVGPARDLAEGVSKLLGAPCRIQLTDRGEIVSVEPSEQLKQVAASASGNATSGLLGVEEMTQILRQAAVVLPEKPVAEGTKWEVKQKSAAFPVAVLLANHFTYVGATERDGTKLDQIAVTTSFALDPGTAAAAPSVKLREGSQSGNYWFDSATGRMVDSEFSQRLVTERPYRDLSIRVQSTSAVSMKLMK